MNDRDLVGYGPTPPFAGWPGWARVAVSFAIIYEDGVEGEAGASARDPQAYGSRAGFWRLHRLFTDRRVPVTVFGVAEALERSPAAVEAMLAASWEVASHGWRSIDYREVPEEVERDHIAHAVEAHTRVTGERPVGWHQGRPSANTARLVGEGRLRLHVRQLRRRPAPLRSTVHRRRPGTARTALLDRCRRQRDRARW